MTLALWILPLRIWTSTVFSPSYRYRRVSLVLKDGYGLSRDLKILTIQRHLDPSNMYGKALGIHSTEYTTSSWSRRVRLSDQTLLCDSG